MHFVSAVISVLAFIGSLLLNASFITKTVYAEEDKLSPELRLRIEAIEDRVEIMGNDLAMFWKEKGPDPICGAFYGSLDSTGTKTNPTNKSLNQVARHLWTFSAWYSLREPTPEVKAIADNLYDFLITHYYDAADNEFYYMVSEDGSSVVNPKKMLYAESFVILSLSQYSMTFNNPEAAEYALNCFLSIVSRLHDNVNGGFDQTNDPGFLAKGASKGTNTHMHLLESISFLYEATGDERVRNHLEEMTDVFRNKILQPEYYCHTQFFPDWTPRSEPLVEYGHDLQTAWLLINAARVLGLPDDPEIIEAALSMGISSAEEGYDSEMGGYFYDGAPNGTVNRKNKTWWVQAEALNGLWWLYQLTGDTIHLDRLEHTLDWIENFQTDKKYGEWYYTIQPDGRITGQNIKGNLWRAGYHTMRAMMYVDKWIEDYLY